MKNKLILIEGICGSGKTTLSQNLKNYLDTQGIKCKLYSEGDLHPADLAWHAILTLDEYHEMAQNHPGLSEKLAQYSTIEGDNVIIAYTKLNLPSKNNDLMEFFEAKEIYNGKCSLEAFKTYHFKRWEAFTHNVIDDDFIYIFECASLQNHVTELMATYLQTPHYIHQYITELMDIVKPLNPKLVYLNPSNVDATIAHVAKERVSDDKSKWEDWINLVIQYIEGTPLGAQEKFQGYNGVVEFFSARQQLELSLIDQLHIDSTVINNSHTQRSQVLTQIVKP